LQIRLRKDEPAAVGLESLVNDVKAKTAAPLTAADQDDVVFLAKTLAYLELAAAREEHLTPQAAKAWRTTLETSVPASLQATLADSRNGMNEELESRKAQLKKDYETWRMKIDKELADAKQRVADFQQQDNAATAQLTTAVVALQTYVDQNAEQVKRIETQAAPLVAERKALRKPSQPRKQSTAGVKDPIRKREIERQNDENERDYDRDLKAYERRLSDLNRQIEPLERMVTPIYRQKAILQDQVARQELVVKKIQMQLGGHQKDEQRLTKLVADRPAWDSPNNLAILSKLDDYSVISFAAEVERVQRTRKK
jgi:hypothetical protein